VGCDKELEEAYETALTMKIVMSLILENSKLKDCVEFYTDFQNNFVWNDMGIENEIGDVEFGTRAIETLKEIDGS